jgi:hypothetical protein
MTEEFPNNSKRAASAPKTEIPPEVDLQIEKIISGEATVRKPSGFRRFRRSFIAGDASTVGEHVFWNLLLPAAQDAILDMGQTFLEMVIKGEKGYRPRGTGAPATGPGSTSRINYGGISSGGRVALGPAPSAYEPQAKINPNEIYLPTRAEAQMVIDKMFEVLEKYQAVTVANLNGWIGQSSDYMDSKWGWTDLQTADIQRTKWGVHLVLPAPQDLS